MTKKDKPFKFDDATFELNGEKIANFKINLEIDTSEIEKELSESRERDRKIIERMHYNAMIIMYGADFR